jgi:hypothetical protein
MTRSFGLSDEERAELLPERIIVEIPGSSAWGAT